MPVTVNLELMAYVNSQFVYVEKHLKRQLGMLYRDVLTQQCEIERKVLTNILSIGAQRPEEFAYRLKERAGYIGILAEEDMYIAKCTPVLVMPRETTECYNILPVSRNGESMFLTPRTRILTRVRVKTTCDDKLPKVYYSNERWIKFLPIRAQADTTSVLKP